MFSKESMYLLMSILVTIKSDDCPRPCECYPHPSQRAVVCDGDDFTSLPTDLPTWMEQLEMPHNRISHLDANAFVKFPNLYSVKMNGNLLTGLPEGLFAKNPLMKNIDFSANEITHLPKGLFKSTPLVTDLNLEDNKLTKLDEDLFSSMQGMVRLKLSKNLLTSLPEQIFDKLTRLEVLKMNLNLWQCCDIIDALNRVDTEVQGDMQASCMDPHRKRFALKTLVNDKKLKCPGRSNPNKDGNTSINTLGIVQVTLLGVCVVLLAFLSSVAVFRFVRVRSGLQRLNENA